jgi:hypothetical protein
MADVALHQHRAGRSNTPADRVASVLSLAAAPAFATIALVTAWLDRGQFAPLCASGGGFASHGMVIMYLLMSTFHAAAWLKAMAAGFDSARRS